MPLPPVLKPPRYLFLQGQISWFFAELGKALQQEGAAVHRINFNGGDRCFWPLPGAADFRGRMEDWSAYIAGRLQAWDISDLILFGDCRPLHRLAIVQAKARGIRVQVFEEGYLRPDFVTLEEGGVNGHSGLPRDAETYLRTAATLPAEAPVVSIPASFRRRAVEDLLYNLRTALAHRRFPHYRSHRPWHPFREYLIGAWRLPLKFATRHRTAATVRQLATGATPYFLFPLQLAADSQIRFHAPAGGLPGIVAGVIESFARQAPRHCRLVITEHPLDYGPLNLHRLVHDLAAKHRVIDRLVFLRGGSPAELIAAARGLITVNSTIGITAMAGGVPVLALGTAIYDLPGLACQHGLDNYWTAPSAPDPVLFQAFRRVVAARTQINGGFFSRDGINRAVEGSLRRLRASAQMHATSPAPPHPSEVRLPAPPPALRIPAGLS